MASHPYLVALETDGEPAARIARFMEREEVVDSGPLLLHSRPTNAGSEPRFLLNKDLYRSAGAGPEAMSGTS